MRLMICSDQPNYRPQTKFSARYCLYLRLSFCPQGVGGSLYDVTSCLTAWSVVPSGGSLSLVPCSFWGWGLPDRDPSSPLDRDPPWTQTHPRTVKTGRYASSWNAFLLQCNFNDMRTLRLLSQISQRLAM